MSKNKPSAEESTASVTDREQKSGASLVRVLVVFVLMGVAMAIGQYFGRLEGSRTARAAVASAPTGNKTLKSGPWGELEYVPIQITPPEELLPVRSMEQAANMWFFGGFDRDELVKFLAPLDLTEAQRAEFAAPENVKTNPKGSWVTISHELFFGLPPKARTEIYRRLALFDENTENRTTLRRDQLDEAFRDSGVSAETFARFKQVCMERDRFLIAYGIPQMVASIPTYEEKVAFLRAITRRSSMLVRVHITPESNITSLTTYWGKACWSTDVKSILESLTRTPGGGYLDVIELLPPLPTSLLYTYPVPQNPLAGKTFNRDCHWTSFNFFRDPPDPNYGDPDFVLGKLQTDYFPVNSDPRFGDVVLFVTPDSRGIHSAVYLADNLVYTKNGTGWLNPWMLSTLEDVIDQYSFALKPGEKLNLQFYRNKYY